MAGRSESSERIFHRARKDHWPRISHGSGCYLYDTGGRAYLDACAGVHVVSIGHGVEEIAEAMADQARKVAFAYGQFISQPQIDLARKISDMAPAGMGRVFFVSGGSEATEAAMKIARKYHVESGNPSKYQVISCWQSWHGNTIGALSMSGRSAWRKDYTPYLLDFPHISQHRARRIGTRDPTGRRGVHFRLHRRTHPGDLRRRAGSAGRLLPHGEGPVRSLPDSPDRR